MESTGKYWSPVYNILENDCTIVLVHPKYVKAILGKKLTRKMPNRLLTCLSMTLFPESLCHLLISANSLTLCVTISNWLAFKSSEKNVCRAVSRFPMPIQPHQHGCIGIVCCEQKHINYFQPHTDFPAQSLHFRFGSVAPCPTLKPNVATSVPRTWYRRLARPYLIGFSYGIVISLPKPAEFLPLARRNQLCWFRNSHSNCIIPHVEECKKL